jgi:hypothetical protein
MIAATLLRTGAMADIKQAADQHSLAPTACWVLPCGCWRHAALRRGVVCGVDDGLRPRRLALGDAAYMVLLTIFSVGYGECGRSMARSCGCGRR